MLFMAIGAIAAAVLLAIVPFIARPLFDISVDALDEIEAGAFVGSLFGVLFLIAIPVILLGTCSPWAIRLAVPMNVIALIWVAMTDSPTGHHGISRPSGPRNFPLSAGVSRQANTASAQRTRSQ